MADTITKRIHVGGLVPNITVEHLRDRFRSFGTVLAVEEMGLNALGDPRPFAYLTLQTTPVQFRKCLNIMSGATWRGTTLRLAEARPRFDARLDKERTPNPGKEARRVSRRLKRAIAAVGGKEAQDMRVVTRERVARRAASSFWVHADGRLIRPLAMRPAHPLPSLGASAKKDGPPPKRARVRTIDPRRWGASHAVEGDMPGPVERGEQWEFVDAEEEMDEDGRVRLGAWIRGGEEEEVCVRRALEWSDAETESEGGEPLGPGRERSASPLFPTRTDGSASPVFPAHNKERSASPLFAARDAPPARDGSTSPLFPVRDRVAWLEEEDAMARSSRAPTPSPSPARIAEVVSLLEEQLEAEEVEGERAERSPTPPISPLKAAEGVVMAARARDDRAASPAQAAGLEDVRAQAASERGAALSVLTSLLGDAPTTGKARREWTAFEEESDDDIGALKPQAYESSSDTEIAPVERARAPSPKTPDVALRARWLEQMEQEEEGADEPATVSNDVLEDLVLRLRGGAPESDEEEETVLRLRGGAPDESDDEDDSGSGSDDTSDSDDSSDSSDDSSDSSDDSSDSDSDDSSDDSDDSSDSGSAAAPSSPAGAARLKDLFAPTSGGFALAGVAPDLDIDETIVLQPTAEEPELAPLASAPRSTFDASPDIPLFFPLPVRPVRRGEARSVLADAPDVNGEEADEGAEEEEGWGEPQRRWGQEQVARPTEKLRKRLVATETDAEMRERWEKRRLELTQGWKRRHREAVKHRRRRGGLDVE